MLKFLVYRLTENSGVHLPMMDPGGSITNRRTIPPWARVTLLDWKHPPERPGVNCWRKVPGHCWRDTTRKAVW